MYRTCLCFGVILLASSLLAQDAPPDESHEIVLVEETGGEWEQAEQPKVAEVVKSIVDRTNAFRKEQKRKPVAANVELTQAAQAFADYMAKTGRYGHTADGQTPAARAKAAGYDYCTVRENIAYAFRSKGFSTEDLAERFFTGWKESPGHRRNMLARWVADTGVAIAKSEETDTYFAVQLFGRPESAAVAFEIANRSKVTVEYRVGDRDYSVSPRVIRTHKSCTPVTVEFLPLASQKEASHPPRPIKTVKATGGERMTIEVAEGGYLVNVEDAPETSDAPQPNAGR
ncbi:MAG: CAP domain-containing protein [Planctomycetaceae bacterium]|nr:CAP domain-containing protein [Planctomycetaceae bacterium]